MVTCIIILIWSLTIAAVCIRHWVREGGSCLPPALLMQLTPLGSDLDFQLSLSQVLIAVSFLQGTLSEACTVPW